jgi:hypothetical protein
MRQFAVVLPDFKQALLNSRTWWRFRALSLVAEALIEVIVLCEMMVSF